MYRYSDPAENIRSMTARMVDDAIAAEKTAADREVTVCGSCEGVYRVSSYCMNCCSEWQHPDMEYSHDGQPAW